jgi:hypothetical protein
MNHSVRLVLPFLLVASLAAQGTLSVNPNSNVQAGQQVAVTYSNPALAGQVVVVVVVGGSPRVEQTVAIKLDAAGSGTANWTVPTDWDNAEFSAPQAASVRIAID